MITEEYKKFLDGKICPYCKKPSVFTSSKEVYGGKDYGMIYLCRDCDAYCGVHKNTEIALGRLANKNLRELKKKAHFYFDQLWKERGMTRYEAYGWLSKTLNLPREYTHIGFFTEDVCKNTISYCYEFLNQK